VASRQLLFKTFYRLGFVPWDGHPLAKSLQKLIEGDGALSPGAALDLGCGTGDNSILSRQARLAGHRCGFRCQGRGESAG
jgi:hypothetical protein